MKKIVFLLATIIAASGFMYASENHTPQNDSKNESPKDYVTFQVINHGREFSEEEQKMAIKAVLQQKYGINPEHIQIKNAQEKD